MGRDESARAHSPASPAAGSGGATSLVVDAPAPTRWVAHASPTRSPLFDAGRTSRLNLARFMAELTTDGEASGLWRGRMPVVYDEGWDARTGPARQATGRCEPDGPVTAPS